MDSSSTSDANASGVGVIDKASYVLAALEAGPQTLTQLVTATHLARPTAHRLAVALEFHRFVARDSQGRFVLGPRLGELASAAGEDRLLASANPVLVALRDHTGESAQLYRRQGDVRRLDAGAAVDPDPALTGTDCLEPLPQLVGRQQESELVGEFERGQRAGPGNVPRHGIDGFANAPEAVPGAGVQEHPGRGQPSRPIGIQHRGGGIVSQPEIPRCRRNVPLLHRKTGGLPGPETAVEDERVTVPVVLQKPPRPGSGNGPPVVVDHDGPVVADPRGPHRGLEGLGVGERMPSARTNARGSQRRVHVH